MINRQIMLRNALLKAYRETGINITQAVQQSVIFNFALAKTKFQLESNLQIGGVKIPAGSYKTMDIFRTKVSANMPKILKFLEGLVKSVS